MVQTVIDCVSVNFLNLTIQGHRGLKAGTLLWQFFDHFVLIFITPGQPCPYGRTNVSIQYSFFISDNV
jgi:hypothetical protein